MTLLYIRATILNDGLARGQSLEDLSHLKCYELQVCTLQRVILHFGEVYQLSIDMVYKTTSRFNDLSGFTTARVYYAVAMTS